MIRNSNLTDENSLPRARSAEGHRHATKSGGLAPPTWHSMPLGLMQGLLNPHLWHRAACMPIVTVTMQADALHATWPAFTIWPTWRPRFLRVLRAMQWLNRSMLWVNVPIKD